MGYDSTRFLCEIDEEFHCTICSMVLENPVQTPCDHSFCHECIRQWLSVNAICPVDRHPIAITDLRPSSRLIRNFLAKMSIKCDYHSEGCTSVIALEHLQEHLTSCEYNPNAEIICDKGCNLRMTRHEYETSNCLAHFANRVASQDREIIELTHELSNQKEDFQRKFIRQKERYQLQKEENRKLNDEVSRLQEEIGSLSFYPKQIGIQSQLLKWQKLKNMKISTDQLNILQPNSIHSRCFAQLCYSLDSLNSSFKVQCLEIDSEGCMGIGLSSSQVLDKESIIYYDSGKLKVGIIHRDVPKLEVGDIIECGIDYTYNFNIDGTYNVELYFYKNAEFILKELVKTPRDGFYPSVWMLGINNKIKYSSH